MLLLGSLSSPIGLGFMAVLHCLLFYDLGIGIAILLAVILLLWILFDVCHLLSLHMLSCIVFLKKSVKYTIRILIAIALNL